MRKALLRISMVLAAIALALSFSKYLDIKKVQETKPRIQAVILEFYKRYNGNDFGYINQHLLTEKLSSQQLEIFYNLKNKFGEVVNRDEMHMRVRMIDSEGDKTRYGVKDYTIYQKAKTVSSFILVEDEKGEITIKAYNNIPIR